MKSKKPTFDLNKLLKDVFDPQPGEKVLVMVDAPGDHIPDHPDWKDRRAMAEEWRIAFEFFQLEVAPHLTYPATGANNADLPAKGQSAGKSISIADAVKKANIVVAMTEYSATAPLSHFVRSQTSIRVASMPGVLRRMEKTALAADYRVIAQRTHRLADLLTEADAADVVFTTGHEMTFDLRFRRGLADDGICTKDKAFPLINLPSGEAFIVPYEGENENEISLTRGHIPVQIEKEDLVLVIEENRIHEIQGDGQHAERMRDYFKEDPARRNVAELGLGCNEAAVVSGVVIEDEKVGMHWAFGRSEHLGGTVGPSAFIKPENVVHHDIVYARGCPIGVRHLHLRMPDGSRREIIRHNHYVIFE